MHPRLVRCLFVPMLAVLATSCERLDVGPELAGELSRARHAARGVLAIGADSARAAEAGAADMLALLYLERHRLGLGSPFRLIDLAMTDPRLDDRNRRRIAWMLLARTMDGDGHAVDAAALDFIGTRSQAAGAAGARHRAVIEQAVSDARDPRAGELAVRVAYSIGAADGVVSSWSPVIAARAAALARDREIARDDARTLLRVARAQGSDPLALVPLWRAARRFGVERPAMEPLAQESERETLELIPRITTSLRIVAQRLAAEATETSPQLADAPADSAEALEVEKPSRHHIHPIAALRLTELARVANLPPQAPVIVSISAHRSRLLERREVDAQSRAARARFITNARNEETFAAEYSLLRQRPEALAGAPALAALAAAVSLRAYAQEEVWWPGMHAPSTRDLRDRFGLAAVTFDNDVPAEWKPYYTRMVSFALSDLQRVMPALRLRGLSIHIGESYMRSEALALHDPRDRTIYLPLATSAGTLAHEVAHDLDWQVARTRYGTRGEYASDRAIRDRDGSPLAQSLQGLTSAALIPPLRQNNHRPPHDSRPAEVFARSVDWFVAVSLAREGRSNGYLSSVQDDLLTGYVTVSPPDVTGEAGEALVRILDDVAPVASATREWFLQQYGSRRSLGPHDLARQVLEYSLPLGGLAEDDLRRQLAAISAARDIGLASVQVAACRSGGDAEDRRLAAARTRVVMLAGEARARGLIRGTFSTRMREDGRRYALQQAVSASASPLIMFDPLPAELVRSMLEQARLLQELEHPVRTVSRERCQPVVTG